MSEYGETRTGMWDELRRLFSADESYGELTEEEVRYERRFTDRQIERFLDQHFSDYVHEFGLVDEVTLELRTERLDAVEAKAHELVAFVKGLDDEVRDLEARVAEMEKPAGKKR